MFRQPIDPFQLEIDAAEAPGMVWQREPAETAEGFIHRVRAAAGAAGFTWFKVSGSISVEVLN